MQKQRTIYSFLIFYLFTLCLNAQSSIQWQKSMGGTDDDQGIDVVITADGGYIMVGGARSHDGDVSNNHSNVEDVWIVKLDSNRVIEWKKSLGGAQADIGAEVHQTTDGGYIVAAFTRSDNGDVVGYHGKSDIWILKLSATGNIQWKKVFGGNEEEYPLSIEQTPDGGYIVAGETNSNNNGDVGVIHGYIDCWVLKLDSNGNLEWQKTYGGSDEDRAIGIKPTPDGGYIMIGKTTSNDGDINGGLHGLGLSDCWVVKLDHAGAIVWQKTYGGTEFEIALGLDILADGSYIVCGQTLSKDGDISFSHGEVDAWVFKLSVNGDLEWEKTYGGSNTDAFVSIRTTKDGGFIAGGITRSADQDVSGYHPGSPYGGDGWVVKIDATGNLKWAKALGGSGWDEIYRVIQSNDGGYIVAGFNTSSDGDVTVNKGGSDYWLLKLAPVAAGIIEDVIPSVSLYPNPAQDQLHWSIPEQENVQKILIYNQLGQEVSDLQAVTDGLLDISTLSGGCYTALVFTDAGKVYSGKFIKL